MTYRSLWLPLLAAGGVLAVSITACSSDGGGKPQTGDPQPDGSKVDKLIGGVPANSRSLNAVGAVGIRYNFYPFDHSFGGSCGWDCGGTFEPLCTGTLIDDNTVLTSRSCAENLSFLPPEYSLEFAIGANAYNAERRVEVVHVQFAPATDGLAPDVAVLHLAEHVSNVTPFAISALSDANLGQQFAFLGYGARDNLDQRGARRAGAMNLEALSGKLYELAFGDFESFFSAASQVGFYGAENPPYFSGGGGFGGRTGVGGGSTGGAAGEGPMDDVIGEAGASSAGTGGTFNFAGAGGGSGGTTNNWYREHLQNLYDTTFLRPSEVYAGGEDAAQPCNGDEGGPLARKERGALQVFGVFSRTPIPNVCANGAVFERITPEIAAFLDAAKAWVDPCQGIARSGQCVDNVATRCSTRHEGGERRAMRYDCDLLGQICAVGIEGGEVTCVDAIEPPLE